MSWRQYEDLLSDNITNIIGDMARDMNIELDDNSQDVAQNGGDSVIQAKLVLDYVTLVTHTKVEYFPLCMTKGGVLFLRFFAIFFS